MQKKDKEKVLDEVWTQEHIESFLDLAPPNGVNADFHAVNTAYKNMRCDDFAIFIELFRQAGRNFSAQNPEGKTALDIIKQHRHGNDYAALLESVM